MGGSPEQIIHSYVLHATNHVRTCANYELSKGFVFRPHRAVGGKNRVSRYRIPVARKPTASDEVVSPRYVQAMCGEGNPPTAKASSPITQGGRRHPATLRKGKQAKDIEGKRGKERKRGGGKRGRQRRQGGQPTKNHAGGQVGFNRVDKVHPSPTSSQRQGATT